LLTGASVARHDVNGATAPGSSAAARFSGIAGLAAAASPVGRACAASEPPRCASMPRAGGEAGALGGDAEATSSDGAGAGTAACEGPGTGVGGTAADAASAGLATTGVGAGAEAMGAGAGLATTGGAAGAGAAGGAAETTGGGVISGSW
jgi:hypothetical protein